MAKKWPEMVVKPPFMSHNFSVFFLTKLKKNCIGKICTLYRSFWSNWDLDTFSPSKWLLAPKFCERCSCSWQRMARNGVKGPNLYVVLFVSKQSLTGELLSKLWKTVANWFEQIKFSNGTTNLQLFFLDH